MKKLVALVTTILVMAVSGMCFAAGDGTDLNKQQRGVDKFVTALNTPDSSGFAQLRGDMVADLQNKITPESFAELQKQLKERFGTQKAIHFMAYERFDQGDRLTYLVNYSRQQVVRAIYGFDKNGKMNEFVFVPLEVQQEQK